MLTLIVGIGYPSHPIASGVYAVTDSSSQRMVHFENCTNGIYVAGAGHHVLINCTGGSGVTNLLTIDAGFTGTIEMIGCLRAGATYLINDLRSGGVGQVAADLPHWTSTSAAGYAISADNTVKAWCLFNGTLTGTNPPVGGFNVASVQRISSGTYRINYTNPCVSTNQAYSVMAALSNYCIQDLGGGDGYSEFSVNVSGTPTDSTPLRFLCVGLGT